MATCAAIGCTNNRIKKVPGLSYHKFPSNEPIRSEWIKAVKKENWIPSKNSVLCSRHFTDDCVDRSMRLAQMKPNAVPTIFNFPHQKTVQNVQTLNSSSGQSLSINKNLCIIKVEPATPQEQNIQTLNSSSSQSLEISENQGEIQVEPSISQVQNIQTLNSSSNQSLEISENQGEIEIEPSISRLATEAEYKRKFEKMSHQLQANAKKIRLLNQTIRRDKQRIVSLKNVIKTIKDKKFVNDGILGILKASAGANKELFQRMAARHLKKKQPKKYSPELRAFALKLHFYSPAAYAFVRRAFNYCLPHPKAITKWYTHINGKPGYTSVFL